MTVQELIDRKMFQEINIGDDTGRIITKPFGCVWVTVMGNLNTLAVVALTDAACVILAEGAALDEAAVKRAAVEGITVLRTEEPVFDAALRISQLLK